MRKSFVLSPHWCDPQTLEQNWLSRQGSAGHPGLKPLPTRRFGSADEHAAEEQIEEYEGCLRPFIVAPSSHLRLAWDIAGLPLIFWDIITIPLGVFNRPETTFSILGDWTTQLFWTADMVASCFTGIVDHGNTIMHPKKIISHYLRTWFILDVVVVGLDWFVTFLGVTFGGGATDMVKLIRILRIVRILRLLRLAKLKRIINQIYDHINSEHTSIIMNIVKLVAFLLIVNHIIACLWYLVSDSYDGRGRQTSWVKHYRMHEHTWKYQYLTALHWSLTQFTPASMHVQPQNSYERGIAIFIIILALLMFSSVVGSITSSMTQLRALRENEWKQFWLLRRYLRQQAVPMILSVRIQRYLEYACGNRKEMVPPSAVNILSLLSDQLKDELECAIIQPNVRVHCLFKYMDNYFAVTLNRLARKAITRKLLARYDSLFYHTDIALGMYFTICGDLSYSKPKMSDGRRMSEESRITHEHCLSEPALWSPRWEHLGEVKAQSECDMIAILPQKFADIVTSNPGLLINVRNYAQHYVEWLSLLDVDALSDVEEAANCEAHMVVEKPVHREASEKPMLFGSKQRLMKSVRKKGQRWNHGMHKMFSRCTEHMSQSPHGYKQESGKETVKASDGTSSTGSQLSH